MNSPLTVNGREYSWPQQPLVAVCIDGSQPEYIEEAIAGSHMAFTQKMLDSGTDLRGHSVVPSFTNPNNLSIVTGVPPKVHGISGNFFLDPESGQEVMMNDPKFLRTGTLFQAFHEAGAKIAIVTAKDKLRRLLGHGLDYTSGRAICFSSEKANETTLAENGIENAQSLVDRPIPIVYSAELSEFIFDAGAKLMQSFRPDLMYLSTTDYIQHKHAPGAPVANAFYAMMDGYLAKLDAMGATIALTADHGMKAKHGSAGKPNVIYLDPLFVQAGLSNFRVILPITDPYVVHHGALGGFATIYLDSQSDRARAREALDGVTGVEKVLTRNEACELFGLPPDRIGDLVVISTGDHVLGSAPEKHDLSGLKDPLRSHGGLSEQRVPFIVNRCLEADATGRRNFDIFNHTLNHVVEDDS